MYRTIRMIILLSLACALQGCMTINTATLPHGVDDQDIVLGMDREDVEAHLNAVGFDVPLDRNTLVEYRYEDFEAPRERLGLYAVAGPADLVFAPIEIGIHYFSQRWARAIYNFENELVWFMSQGTGNYKIKLGGTPEPLQVKRRHTFLDAVLGSGHAFEETSEQD